MKIEFTTENAAFKGNGIEPESKWEADFYRNEEIKRVLKNVCNQLDNGKIFGKCIDINGNLVGEWELGGDD